MEFIQDLKEYYEIINNKIIKDLTILFKIKIYELDINSMIFFFNYFEKDNESWNQKLSEKYQNLSLIKDFNEIKEKLSELKSNKIYDYQNIQNYNKLFTCLYEKSEAIDFLFSKVSGDIEKLKDIVQPTDRTISIKDLLDTEICISEITKMKEIKDNDKIFLYIESMNEITIEQFVNYCGIASVQLRLLVNTCLFLIYVGVLVMIERKNFRLDIQK